MTSFGMLSPCSPQATSITGKQQQIRSIQSVMVFYKYKISNFLDIEGCQQKEIEVGIPLLLLIKLRTLK
jgi:hypothetical protein